MNRNTIPDAEDYVGEIVNTSAKKTAKGVMFEMLLRVSEGQYTDTVVPKRYNINGPDYKALILLRKECDLLGIKATNVKEVLAKKAEYIGIKCRFSATTGNEGYQAYHFKRFDQPTAAKAAAPMLGALDDIDIPF